MLWDNLRPEVRQRLTPYRQVIEDAARRNGVPPDLLYAKIAAESSGLANAVGDGGRAGGLWQVQKAFTRDYGMTDPAQRFDPVVSTNAVVPKIAEMFRRRGGDWGLVTAQYMRGKLAATRLQNGEPPEKVFAGDAVGLARYQQAVKLQRKYGGAGATSTSSRPPSEEMFAGDADALARYQQSMKQKRSDAVASSAPPATTQAVPAAPPDAGLPPFIPTIAPGAPLTPLPPAQPVARVGGMGGAAPKPQADGVDDVMRLFGLDRLV